MFYKTVMMIADKRNDPDSAPAEYINAMLTDLGLASKLNRSKLVDLNTVKRQRIKLRAETPRPPSITSLYFDGKQSETLALPERNVKKEHIALISQPDNTFIGSCVCEQKNALEVSKRMIESLDDVDTSNLEVMAGDGTNTNVGYKGGVIRFVEQHLNRKLHWIVCKSNIII